MSPVSKRHGGEMMKDLVLIDRKTAQHKGCVHMHTDRSPDSTVPYAGALAEYREKGFRFCVMTDHEIYWNSREQDREDFIVLAGAERALRPNEAHPFLLSGPRQMHCHLNLIWDVTAGPCPYGHDERLPRPIDWGISSWNRLIRSCGEQNQLVIFNHPGWSHVAPETLLAVEGCFALEVWNTGAVKDLGGASDDGIWDYCLERGKRIWAVAGDDTHHYGPDYGICGACATVALTDDFSREGLCTALRNGQFYPTTGPELRAMEVKDGVLHMDFSPAVMAQVVGGSRWGRACYAGPGEELTHLDWPVDSALNYFRVRVVDGRGGVAWSQPVFMEDLLEE